MSRKVKELAVKEYRQRYQGIKNGLFVEYRGLKATQSIQLRNWLKSEEIQINILKNSVARLAFKSPTGPDVGPFITGPVAFICSKPGGKGDDPITLAKRVRAFERQHKLLKIQGGLAEGRVVSEAEIKELAKLPTRQELFSLCARLLNGPMTGLARGLNAIVTRFAVVLYVLAARGEKASPEPLK